MWLKRQRFPPATCQSSSDHKTLPGQLSKSRRTMSFNLEWPDWCPARPSHSGLKFVRVRKANIRPAGAGCRRFPGQGRMLNPPENANGPLIEEALHATHTTDFFWLPSQIKEGAPHQTHASLPACMYPRKLHIYIYIHIYVYIYVCVYAGASWQDRSCRDANPTNSETPHGFVFIFKKLGRNRGGTPPNL
jgi:hypothetical protein